MKISITGANGSIGSEKLKLMHKNDNYQVIALSRKEQEDCDNIK